MDIASIKGKTVTEEWIRCESNIRPGNFYMFNSATGETKRCPNQKQKSNSVAEGNLNESRLEDRSLPLKLTKSISTPAQDRLKRLQHILKKETKERQRTEINKSKLHMGEIPNRNTNIDFYKVLKKVSSEGSKYKEIKIDTQTNISDCIKQTSKANEDIRTKQDKNTASDKETPLGRERIESTKFPNVSENETNGRSNASCRKAPKRQSSSISNESSCTKITKTTAGETANRQSSTCLDSPADKNGSVTNTLQNIKIQKLGLGIMDKIKSICKKTFSITSKVSATSKNKKSQIADIKKLRRHADSVMDTNKHVRGSIGYKKENESDGREKSILILPPTSSLSQQECKVLPTSTSVTSIPSPLTDLLIPTYQRGSANSRLDCLRQHLRELSNEVSIVTSKTLTASRVPVCPTNAHKDVNGPNAAFSSNAKDLEPMDWQPIDSEGSEPIIKIDEKKATNGNPKNNDDSSTSNTPSPKISSPISEYYEIVNENLLRFSADEVKGVSNLKQNWMKNCFYFVLDTNVLLENLAFIDDLSEMKLCGTVGTVIYIPYMVLQELDKLKIRSSSESTKALASRAIRFLNEKFEERNLRLQAQSAFDDRKHLINITSPDDSVLNCCLQVKENVKNVLLLSEDVNLRNKAMCSNLLASTKSYLTSFHPSSPLLPSPSPSSTSSSSATSQTLSETSYSVPLNSCENHQETAVVK